MKMRMCIIIGIIILIILVVVIPSKFFEQKSRYQPISNDYAVAATHH